MERLFVSGGAVGWRFARNRISAAEDGRAPGVLVRGDWRPFWDGAPAPLIFLTDKLASLPTVNTNVSPKSYDALAGRYELLGRILTIRKSGAHLFAQYADQPEGELFPESETEFFAKVVEAQFTFVKGANGEAVKLILHQNGLDLTAPRVKDIVEAKVDLGNSSDSKDCKDGGKCDGPPPLWNTFPTKLLCRFATAPFTHYKSRVSR